MSKHRRGAIVISWGSAIAGRELKMREVLGRVLEYTMRLQREERVEDVRVFVPKIGAFRDTCMLGGSLDSLMSVLTEPEFEKLMVEGTLFVQDLRLDLWEGGTPDWLAGAPDPYVEQLQKHNLV